VTGKRRPEILIVDDQELIRAFLGTILHEDGYNVVAQVSNGEEALKFCTSRCPDVVCLDIDMPRMNGLQTLGKIREQYPVLPVIMITGDATQESVKEAIEKGANDYIIKPFNARKVLETVSRYVALQEKAAIDGHNTHPEHTSCTQY